MTSTGFSVKPLLKQVLRKTANSTDWNAKRYDTKVAIKWKFTAVKRNDAICEPLVAFKELKFRRILEAAKSLHIKCVSSSSPSSCLGGLWSQIGEIQLVRLAIHLANTSRLLARLGIQAQTPVTVRWARRYLLLNLLNLQIGNSHPICNLFKTWAYQEENSYFRRWEIGRRASTAGTSTR